MKALPKITQGGIGFATQKAVNSNLPFLGTDLCEALPYLSNKPEIMVGNKKENACHFKSQLEQNIASYSWQPNLGEKAIN